VTAVPSNAILQFHLGMARVKSGSKDQGYENLRKALEIDPDFPGAEEASAALTDSVAQG
jgi:Tfp pilus assembly protein PilF